MSFQIRDGFREVYAKPSRRRLESGARGFTMAEMVIVVALIGITAVLATPWFLKISQRNQLKSCAFEIQAALMGARMSAVKRNTATTVTITPAMGVESNHEITTVFGAMADPPPPTPTPVAVSPTLFISKKMMVFTTLPPGNAISFRGDGSLGAPPFPTPGVIVVEGPPGVFAPNQITIQTDPNGHVRVVTPTNWN